MKKIILFLLAAITGCETVVDVNLPDQEPEVVVNSVVRPDSSFWVEVSHTSPISTGIDIYPVKGAVVKVVENNSGEHILNLVEVWGGELIGHVNEKKVYYRSDSLIPQIGNDYHIEVRAPGYETAIARPQKIPARPEVAISDFQYRVDNSFIIGPFGPDGYRFDVEFEISDDPDRENFYNLAVYEKIGEWTPKVFSTDDVALVSHFEDEILEGKTPVRETFGHYASFDDRLFNGKTKKIRIRIQHSFFEEDSKLLRFELSSITSDLYEYHKSLRESGNRVQVNNVSLPLSEPVRIFTNIEEGYGIFGAYTPRTFIWDFDEKDVVHQN